MDQNFEFRPIRSDGSVRWVYLRGQVVRDEQGAPLRLSGISVDITERKQAEEALRRSEARYRTLFDSIEEGFGIIEMQFDGQDRPDDRDVADAAHGAGEQGRRHQHDHPFGVTSRWRAAAGSTGDASSVSQAVARSSIGVLLVDDHAMVRQGLCSALESYSDLEVVGEAWDGEEAVSRV